MSPEMKLNSICFYHSASDSLVSYITGVDVRRPPSSAGYLKLLQSLIWSNVTGFPTKGNNSTFCVPELPVPPRATAARVEGRPYKSPSSVCRVSDSSGELTERGQNKYLIHKWAIVTTSTSSTSSHPHLSTASGADNSILIFKVTNFYLGAVFHLRSEKMAAIPSSGSLIATHDYYRRRIGSTSSSSSCGSAEHIGEIIPHHPGLPRQDSGHWWTSFFFAKQNQPGMLNGHENQKNGTYTVTNGQVTCIAREMVLNTQLSESSESGKSEPTIPSPTSS